MHETVFVAASHMTPFMGTIATAGESLIFAGLAGLVVWIFKGWGTRLLRISGRLLVGLGAFFLVSQAMWMSVGLQPSLDYEDAPAMGAGFWVLGLAFVLPGLFMRVVGALRPTY